MAMPYHAIAPYSSVRHDVVSPEQLVAMTFRYNQNAQMHGLSQASSGDYPHGLGKACCTSCAHGGPCEGCSCPPGQCRCGSGMGATSVMRGQADLEPGDYGYQSVSTTKPGTTVFGRRQGFVEPDRRMKLTRMIEELEFLTGTPGVHPRALAQKVWAARRALMGAGNWAWASYADPRQRYDAKADLESRLRTVERLLGVDQLSPRMMMAYGSGMAGLGLAPWGQPQADPVRQLASCIQAALCMPDRFCCPPDSCYDPDGEYYPEDEYYDDEWPEPEPKNGTWIRNGETGIPLRDPPPTGVPLEDPPPIIGIPGGGVPLKDPLIKVGGGGVPVTPRTQPRILTGGGAPKMLISTPGSYGELVDKLPQARGRGGSITLRPISHGESIEDYKKYLVGQGLAPQQIQSAVGTAQQQLQRDAAHEAQRQAQIKAREEAQKAAAAQAKAAAEARAAAQAKAAAAAAAAKKAAAAAAQPKQYVTAGPQPVPGSWEWHDQRTDYAAIQQAAKARIAKMKSAPWSGGGASTAFLAGLGSLGNRPLMNMPAMNALRMAAQNARIDAARRRS
jgi:hypothetical protein